MQMLFASPIELATAGVARAIAIEIGGTIQFALQTTGIATDTFTINVSLDGTNFVNLSTISADGITQVSGVYGFVKVTKASGAGTTAKIILFGAES
jgi:threonine/homoserine efflux transporter RhtA